MNQKYNFLIRIVLIVVAVCWGAFIWGIIVSWLALHMYNAEIPFGYSMLYGGVFFAIVFVAIGRDLIFKKIKKEE